MLNILTYAQLKHELIRHSSHVKKLTSLADTYLDIGYNGSFDWNLETLEQCCSFGAPSKNLKMTFCQLFHLILHEIDSFGCFMLKSGFFFKKLGTFLNPFAPGDFAEKRVLKPVEWFSGHCHAIKS